VADDVTGDPPVIGVALDVDVIAVRPMIVAGRMIVAVQVNVNPTVELIEAAVGDAWLTPSTGRTTATTSLPFTCVPTNTSAMTHTVVMTIRALRRT
jgi:hypothetical protein